MDTEKIYDEKIASLMKEIIDTCKANSIGMHATFLLRDSEDQEVYCHSHIEQETDPSLYLMYLVAQTKGNFDRLVMSLLHIAKSKETASIYLNMLQRLNKERS